MAKVELKVGQEVYVSCNGWSGTYWEKGPILDIEIRDGGTFLTIEVNDRYGSGKTDMVKKFDRRSVHTLEEHEAKEAAIKDRVNANDKAKGDKNAANNDAYRRRMARVALEALSLPDSDPNIELLITAFRMAGMIYPYNRL